MPIFDYKCEKCGVVEERIVSIGRPEKQYCKTDGELMLKQDSFAPSQFKFKGKWFTNAKEY